MLRSRRAAGFALAVALIASGVACEFLRPPKRETPLPKGVEPSDLVDVSYLGESADPLGPLESNELTKLFIERRADWALQRRARELKIGKDKDGKPFQQKEYNILAISGGGVFGAYPAGILCGWTESGKTPQEGGRPSFDVVTGISTGSLIAPLAFLGTEYDPVMKQLYTTVKNEDVFKIRRSIRSYFAESLADNSPLRTRIEAIMDPPTIAKIAAEHKKGRRLYVGTTNLDTKRLVVWDMGAIAAKGTPADRKLFIDVMVASAAIPGFFPSMRFNVTIDGKPYEELHVDGGVSRALFFRPPYIADDRQEEMGPGALTGSNLFALVAGKNYPDPEGLKPRTISIVGAAVSNLLYVASRGDLYRFWTYSMLSGMDFFSAAIPPELEITSSSTNFDPVETTKMFNEGFRLAKEGAFSLNPKVDPKAGAKPAKYYLYPDGSPIMFKEPGVAWRNTPPGLETNERGRNRAGTQLLVKKKTNEPPRPQGKDQDPGGAPPVAK